MASNLKEIRERIRSVKTTQQMTRAMKMVAAAKLRKAQDNILRLRPYANKLAEILTDIKGNMAEGLESPYAVERVPEKILLVVITSNRGLCGGFNMNVIKLALDLLQGPYQKQHKAGNVEFLCMGRKGYDFFAKKGYKMVGKNHDVFQKLNFATVSDVAQTVMDGFTSKRWDKVDLIYNEFKNIVVQKRKQEQFLPVGSIDSLGGHKSPAKDGHKAEYIFEPAQEKILATLIPRSLKTSFYKSVLESNAGEQGARMTAMNNATDNAEELVKVLRLNYNQARQAAITTEILEIVGGADALASG